MAAARGVPLEIHANEEEDTEGEPDDEAEDVREAEEAERLGRDGPGRRHGSEGALG